jgi:hypothetical protein
MPADNPSTLNCPARCPTRITYPVGPNAKLAAQHASVSRVQSDVGLRLWACAIAGTKLACEGQRHVLSQGCTVCNTNKLLSPRPVVFAALTFTQECSTMCQEPTKSAQGSHMNGVKLCRGVRSGSRQDKTWAHSCLLAGTAVLALQY